jgi:hypothetical protein
MGCTVFITIYADPQAFLRTGFLVCGFEDLLVLLVAPWEKSISCLLEAFYKDQLQVGFQLSIKGQNSSEETAGNTYQLFRQVQWKSQWGHSLHSTLLSPVTHNPDFPPSIAKSHPKPISPAILLELCSETGAQNLRKYRLLAQEQGVTYFTQMSLT